MPLRVASFSALPPAALFLFDTLLGFLLRGLPLFGAAALPLFDLLLSGSLLPLLLLQLPQTLLILALLLLTLLLLQTLPLFTLLLQLLFMDALGLLLLHAVEVVSSILFAFPLSFFQTFFPLLY